MKLGEGEPQAQIIGGATFLIRILYCQNASWQGTVQWLDNKKRARFRSTLELLLLIQQALAAAQIPPDTDASSFASWEQP